MAVKIKRVYDSPGKSDGLRILVDRLWPRGISKQKARIDLWMREIGPSHALRKWFNHRPERWEEFRKRYWKELRSSQDKEYLDLMKLQAGRRAITLLFAAKDLRCNNAKALAEFLKRPK